MLRVYKHIPFIFLLLIMFVSYWYGFYSSATSQSTSEVISLNFSISEKFSILFLVVKNNFTLAFLISFLGFMSSGLMVYVLVAWNSYLTGLICNDVFLNHPSPYSFIGKHILPHGILEIVAFLLFARIGLKGYFFFRSLLIQKKLDIKQLPGIKTFLIPSVLLLLSAFLEAFVSSL